MTVCMYIRQLCVDSWLTNGGFDNIATHCQFVYTDTGNGVYYHGKSYAPFSLGGDNLKRYFDQR